ncbi:MAG: HNH endonuclease [Methylohalobius sp.]|nr:HNH endonuclease [Methylohalobius sp.]
MSLTGVEMSANVLSLQVLRTDASGLPLEWIGYQEAVKLYCLDQVAYTCGTLLYRIRGGINARSGRQSLIEINSIIATHGHSPQSKLRCPDYTPPLCNRTLFRRDNYLCLYCGGRFLYRDLSRDHVNPLSRGGLDTWNNVVTACKRCNNYKAGRTPEEAGMELLAIPFTPTHAEYIYLQGRRILSDQMEFLRAHFPRRSFLHDRLRGVS